MSAEIAYTVGPGTPTRTASGERAIAIFAGERKVAQGLADIWREDLLDAGQGDGRHGFSLTLDPALFDGEEHCLIVRFDHRPCELKPITVKIPQHASAHATTPRPDSAEAVSGMARPIADGEAVNSPIANGIGTRTSDTEERPESRGGANDSVLSGSRMEAMPNTESLESRDRANASRSTILTKSSARRLAVDESRDSASAARGHIDSVTDTQIRGWAWIPTAVEKSLVISVHIDGRVDRKVKANRFRQDLFAASIGTGKYGFSIRFEEPVNWASIELRIDECDCKMPGGSAEELAEKLNAFRVRQTAKRVLTYYPDYSPVNPYQSRLAASLPRNWESSPGSIDDAIVGIRASDLEAKHVFHLHWVNPVIGSAPNKWIAERQAALFVAKLREFSALGGAVIWTMHNVLSHDNQYEEVERKLCQDVADIATRVHIHSSLVLKETERYYSISPEKLVVLPHPKYTGVYPNYIPRADARRQLGIPSESIVFAFVGQLRPYKGLSELIEAFRQIQEKHENVHLLIAGKPVHPYNADKIRALVSGIDACTLVAEFVPDNQLQVHFNASDFVVLPYRNILTSGSMINALSFSRPVIAPRMGVLPETIVDGENGWMYDPDDKDALRRTMASCVSADVLADRESLFENCKESIDHLTWDDFSYRLSAEVELRLEPEWAHVEVGKKNRRVKIVQSKHDRSVKRDVAIVILNYQNYDDVKRLVASIEAGTSKQIEFFIVDNDSRNLSFAEFVSFVPASGAPTTYMRADHNGGYALGNNIGIAQTLGQDFEFVWVVNPDIVMGEGALDALTDSAIENPNCNLFGSTIYAGGSGGKIWSAGGRLSFENGLDASHLYGGMTKNALPESAYPADYITGASLFCRSSLFERMGLIPEDYFLYFEETEWCLRLRAAGEEILVEPRAELTHFKQSESGSLPSPYYFYYYIRNALVFTQRNGGDAYEKTLVALRNNFISPWLEKIEKRSLGKLECYQRIAEHALKDADVRRRGFRDLNELLLPSDARASSDAAMGRLEYVDHKTVAGWAYDPENAGEFPELAVLVDGQLVGNVTAPSRSQRPDLQDAGHGDGYCSFRFQLPKPIADLKRHTVEVLFADGRPLGQRAHVANVHADYKGRIDGVAGYKVCGWACNSGNADECPAVEVKN